MKITKIQETITKQTPNSKIQIPKLVIGYWSLVIIWLLFLGYWSLPAWAMGGKPPVKEEPKYKVEILKMEVVTSPTPTYQTADLSSKKVLLVIAPKDFHDQEFSKPKEMLEAQGVKITVASSTTNTATGMYGKKVKPDVALKDAKATDYDAVVFIGGNGAAVYADDPQALSLAIEAQKHGKIIGAICIAPVILAKAGVLEGKKATVSPYGTGDLKKAGATCTGKNVETDGKIVTGKGPAAAESFGEALLQALQKE